MSKKRNIGNNSIVYSTDPDFVPAGKDLQKKETLAPADQKLAVRTDTKQRAGKIVTLITGFIGATADIEELGKKIKTYCGTGGTVKDDEIIIQGDNREKAIQYLQKNGYIVVKKN